MIIFKSGDHEFDIADLPLAEYAKIEQETGTAWWDACYRPLRHASTAVLLVAACCRHLGIEAPAVTAASVRDLFHIHADADDRAPAPDGTPGVVEAGEQAGEQVAD